MRVREKVAASLFVLLFACGVSASLYADPAELFRAVKNNDVASVKALIKAGENVNGKADDPQGGVSQAPPLYYAISNGNLEIVKLLLDAGSDPNATPFLEGSGALGYHDALVVFAAQDRRWGIVDLLLAKGAQEKVWTTICMSRWSGTWARAAARTYRCRGDHQAREAPPCPLVLLALQFESGGPEVREFISRHVPEISQSKTSFLEALPICQRK
jgi:hypothetical protein